MEMLEMNIIQIICKLEMIFPLLFFYSMEYLPMHLLFDTKVGGPIQYKWMYPFKRLGIAHAS
jgi:hypothetical protein